MPLLSWRKNSEIICAVNEIGSSLLYAMQLISWCSFSSSLFTVKLRQCIICIIMSQECVLVLTASFYCCCSQPWINPAWSLERWWVYSGDIHFQLLLNWSSLWCKACERMTLALQPRKMSSFWLFLSLCFFLSFLHGYKKFQLFNFKKIVAQRLLTICMHLILIIHVLDFSASNETWFIFYYLLLFI